MMRPCEYNIKHDPWKRLVPILMLRLAADEEF